MNLLPNFLIIGAGKSGTTSLDFYLKQHPDIYMPEVKEPNFFAYESHKIDDFSDQETKDHFNESVTNINDYRKLFLNVESERMIGEVSNTIMYMPHSISTINKYIKNPKLIAILRNPADRLISRYMHLERVNKVPGIELEGVFNKNTMWWKRADLVNEGMYYQHLSRFYSSFDRNNIHVILYDDLKRDVKMVLKRICEFLKVDTSFEFDTSVIYNKSGRVKNKTIQQLIGDNSKVINALKSTVPFIHSSLKKSKLLHSSIQKLRNKNLGSPNIDKSYKDKIITDIYLKDIKSLESLLDRDLTVWYQSKE